MKIQAKKSLYKTMVLALGLFLVGFLLSILAPVALTEMALYFTALLSALGLMGLYKGSGQWSQGWAQGWSEHKKSFRGLMPLWTVQLGMLALGGFFFYFCEQQTRLNARLQAMELGQILHFLQDNWLLLGVAPWLLYSVLGCFLAYYSEQLKQPPTFAAIMVPEHDRHPKLFAHYYVAVVVHAVTFFPILFVSIQSFLWITELMTARFDWPSLFAYPMRTIFILALLWVVFGKTTRKFLAWCQQKKLPLGGILVLYLAIHSFLLLWVHGFATWFYMGAENLESLQNVKSVFAGSLSDLDIRNRIALLIWGWWGIWTPWMASFMGRLWQDFGSSRAWVFCLQAMLLPVAFFYSLHKITAESLQALSTFFAHDMSKLVIAFLLCLFMMLIWGRVHSTADLERGVFRSWEEIRARPLNKWLEVFFLSFHCCLAAVFLVGWLTFQVLGTFGAGFMTTVVFGLLFVSFKRRSRWIAAAT